MIDALNHLLDLKKNSGDKIDIVVLSFGSRYRNSDVENKLKELADLGVVTVSADGNHGIPAGMMRIFIPNTILLYRWELLVWMVL